MAQTNPFDQFDAPGGGFGPLPSPPKIVEPVKPRDPLAIRKDELDIALKEKQLRKSEASGDNGVGRAMTQNKISEMKDSLTSLEQFESDLTFLEGSFADNFDDQGIATPREYLPGALSPINQAYNQASDRLLPLVARALGFTAKQMDTPAELARLQSYVPQAGDSDVAAKGKLTALREMLTRQRANIEQQLGHADDDKDAGPTVPAVSSTVPSVPPSGGTPPPPQFSPGDPAYERATGNQRLVSDPETQATVDRMLREGKPYATINQYVIGRGMEPINRQEYAAAAKLLRENPNARVQINARRYEPVTAAEKIITGLGDNAVGAYTIGAGQFLTGNTLDNLSSDPERARLAMNIAETQSPTATAVGDLSGGIMAGLGGGAGLARLGMGNGLVRGLLADTVMGAANGAGAADALGESRLGGAAVGAASAGAGVIGGYGATRLAQKGVGALYAPVARSLGRDADVAPRQVATALKDDGIVPRDAAARITDAQGRGSPMAIADLGENSREMLASVGRAKGASRAAAMKFVKERQAAQLERIGASVRQELGPTANIRETGDAFMAQARTQAAPLYQEAFDAPGAGAAFPRLETLLNRPSARQALARANRISAEEGIDPKTLGFDLNEQGEVVLTKVPSWRTLHYIKLGMDDVIEGYRDSTTGRLNLDTEGRAINGTLRGMLRIIDDTNPAYAAARSAYAGPAKLKGALEKGVGILSRDPDDILANLRDLSPSETEMYRMGARKGIMEMLESKGDYADKVNALIGTPKKRLALSRVFGNTQGFDRLQQVLGDEKAMGETYRAVATGSQTAGRQAFDEGAHETAKAGVEIAQAFRSGGVTGALASAWLRLSEAAKLGVGPAGDAARAKIADILTAATPEQLNDLAKQLRRPGINKGLRRVAQRKAARSVAGVTGSVSGVAGVNANSE